MKVTPTSIEAVKVIEPKVFGDSRGFFQEIYHEKRYSECLGKEFSFVQDNLSRSAKGVLRGLHFQNPNSQGKLVYVLEGEVFDVAVDLRKGSKTFGKAVWQTLSASNSLQYWVPPGFAHGFVVTSESALFAYKCTELYAPSNEHCLLWNDPHLAIPWPLKDVLVSEKDAKGLLLKDLNPSILF